MSKVKLKSSGEVVELDRDRYDRMVETMRELAFRGPKEEGIVLRIAKSGGITEAVKGIVRLRLYAKKHLTGHSSRSNNGQVAASGKRSKKALRGKRSRSGKKAGASAGAGDGAETTQE